MAIHKGFEMARNETVTSHLEYGADDRSRTYDRLITNQLLYQLSYISNVDQSIIYKTILFCLIVFILFYVFLQNGYI